MRPTVGLGRAYAPAPGHGAAGAPPPGFLQEGAPLQGSGYAFDNTGGTSIRSKGLSGSLTHPLRWNAW